MQRLALKGQMQFGQFMSGKALEVLPQMPCRTESVKRFNSTGLLDVWV
jgi:hypothetical protein